MAFLQQRLGLYFRDDFNRTNNTSLGTDWTTLSGTASTRIVNNAAEVRAQSSNSGENGCWNTFVGGDNTGHFLTDNYKVRAQLKAPSVALATNNVTGIYFACPDSHTSSTKFVFLAVSTSIGASICTQTNAPSAPYTALGTGTGQAGVGSGTQTNATTTSLIEMERIGNLFNAYIDGFKFWSWTDSSNTIATGSLFRRWGIITEGNYPFFGQAYSSPAIDWVEAFDLST
jgi:hypothetical protein